MKKKKKETQFNTQPINKTQQSKVVGEWRSTNQVAVIDCLATFALLYPSLLIDADKKQGLFKFLLRKLMKENKYDISAFFKMMLSLLSHRWLHFTF